MFTLFHAPDSRSSRFIWRCEELGLEYDLVHTDIKRRGGQGMRDPRNPHADGRVPALLHDGQLVTEQLAIVLYLTDPFPDTNLGAFPGSAERADYLSWLAFWASEADPTYNLLLLYGDRLDPMSQRDISRVSARAARRLAHSPFPLGDRFTAAGLFVSGPFEWEPRLVAGEAAISDWLARLVARPGRAPRRSARPSRVGQRLNRCRGNSINGANSSFLSSSAK